MSVARIGFVLLSPSAQALPSTRISVLNMLPYLRAAGFHAEIAFEPPRPTPMPDLSSLDVRALASRYDLVYFQKVSGPSVLACIESLERAGVRTVYGVCDLVEPELVAASSATAVVTDFLRTLHPPALHAKMHVVHDGIEHPDRYRPTASPERGTAHRPLRAVLVTSSAPTTLPVIGRPPEWLEVAIVGAYPKPAWRGARLRWMHQQLAQRPARERLATVSGLLDRRVRRVTWHPSGVYEQLLHSDIGLIPVDVEQTAAWQVKSENRLTLKLAAGLPVIATPIPAYEAMVQPGVNALFARGRDEWMAQLEALRDPARRAALGAAGRASVLPRFSKETQARALIDTLHAALARTPAEAAG